MRRLALAGAVALTTVACGTSEISEESAGRPYRDLPNVSHRVVPVELPSQYEIPAAQAPEPRRPGKQRASRSAATSRRADPPPSAGGAAPLACIRSHESDTSGGYNAVSASGRYRGAYQADQRTWDGVWRRHGRPDLVGVQPETASEADQDRFAELLYAERGLQPWPPARGCAWWASDLTTRARTRTPLPRRPRRKPR